MFIIGGLVFAVGLLILWGLIADVDPTAGAGLKIGIGFLVALFLLTGGAIVGIPLWGDIKARNGKHSLINAIDRSDSNFLLWYYEYITQVKGGGTDHQVWMHCADGKRYFIAAKSSKVAAIMTYLQIKFPNARAGHTELNRDWYDEHVSRQRVS